jgi:hypothetical protein
MLQSWFAWHYEMQVSLHNGKNFYVRSVPFCDITQHRVVIPATLLSSLAECWSHLHCGRSLKSCFKLYFFKISIDSWPCTNDFLWEITNKCIYRYVNLSYNQCNLVHVLATCCGHLQIGPPPRVVAHWSVHWRCRWQRCSCVCFSLYRHLSSWFIL